MAAVAQSPLPNLVIKGQTYMAFPNPSLFNKDKTPKSCLDHIVDYTKSSNGAYRVLQSLEKVCRAAVLVLKEMGSTLVGFVENLAGKFGLAWAMLTIPRLPEVTQAAKKAIVDWSKPPQGPAANTTRDKLEKIHDIADAAASYGYAASLVMNNPAIKNMADIPSLIGDVTDMTMAAEDWSLAREHLKYIDQNPAASGSVQHRFVDTMRYSLIKLVKTVSSVVGGVLGLMALAFGGPVLPVAALLAISILSTASAIFAHFFKETRPHPMVDFHKIRQPVVLAPNGAPAA